MKYLAKMIFTNFNTYMLTATCVPDVMKINVRRVKFQIKLSSLSTSNHIANFFKIQTKYFIYSFPHNTTRYV